MQFKKNKINENAETVGEKLRAAREQRIITLEIASKSLAINYNYLAALETGDDTALPGGVYAKTFLREYSAFLDLNPAEIAEQYRAERGETTNVRDDVFSKKKINRSALAIFPKILKNVLLIAVIIVFLSYLGYYLLNIFSLPNVQIFQPADNLVTQNNSIEVIGRADPKTQVTINSQQILKDEAGNFQEQVDLKKGINTIVISAQNKYSGKRIITKQVLLK